MPDWRGRLPCLYGNVERDYQVVLFCFRFEFAREDVDYLRCSAVAEGRQEVESSF